MSNTPKKPLNVIVFVAHPDEAEEYVGGTAALFVEMGHRVKFVSLTNGDAGHFRIGGGMLAERRHKEAMQVKAILGVDYAILNRHDGELMPTLEVRKYVIRQTRLWQADIVITFHPDGSGHADNRTAGRVVRDASAFMALTPNVVPDVPCLMKSPVFLLVPDYGARATYRPDLAIATDSVLDKKLRAFAAHESQFLEFGPWQQGILDQVPADPDARLDFLLEYAADSLLATPKMRPALAKWYGEERAHQIKYAEAFEIADYGSVPGDDELKHFFPMLGS